MATQRSKFLQWIDFRVRITIQDGRMMVGTFLAFDKHMNVVLADTEEYRITKTNKVGVNKQIKRTLGLVIIRGENVISLTAEAPPSQTFKKTDHEAAKPGKATTINRPGTVPSQPGVNIPNMPSLVGPSAPIPSGLKAPNINVNLPKPPSMPPPQ
jgi:small nuclear ribonucleoprotein B and B'